MIGKVRPAATIEQRRQLRGTLWKCPHCKQGFPLADVGDRLVPVQLVLVRGLHPVANLTHRDGTPLQTDVGKLLKTSTCREINVLVPHIAVCLPAMKALGHAPDLFAGIALEVPGEAGPAAVPKIIKPN